jgi:hypothetical protein
MRASKAPTLFQYALCMHSFCCIRCIEACIATITYCSDCKHVLWYFVVAAVPPASLVSGVLKKQSASLVPSEMSGDLIHTDIHTEAGLF